MNVTIVYASTYGNTRSLATAMAEALIADVLAHRVGHVLVLGPALRVPANAGMPT